MYITFVELQPNTCMAAGLVFSVRFLMLCTCIRTHFSTSLILHRIMILIFIMIIACFTAAVYTIDEVELHLKAHKFSDISLKQSIFNMTTIINFRHPIVLVSHPILSTYQILKSP